MRFSLIDAEYFAGSNSRSNNPDPADPEQGLRSADGARFRCEVLGGGDSRQYKSVSVKREAGLGGKSEQCADEVSLADHISISQPSHPALPNHVHGLDTLQRAPRTLNDP